MWVAQHFLAIYFVHFQSKGSERGSEDEASVFLNLSITAGLGDFPLCHDRVGGFGDLGDWNSGLRDER